MWKASIMVVASRMVLGVGCGAKPLTQSAIRMFVERFASKPLTQSAIRMFAVHFASKPKVVSTKGRTEVEAKGCEESCGQPWRRLPKKFHRLREG